MLIMKAPQAWIKTSFLIGLIAVLTACGGGGSSNPEPPAPDTTPNAFTFENIINAELGSTQTSNTVTISGIDSPAPISVTGGQYAIGSGEPTSTAGTITNGQTVTISLTASDLTLTEVTAALTIGGITGSFSVTTIADTTPDNFSFIEAIDVEPGSMQISNVITVSGVDIEVPISITGGEYAIGEGEYTVAEGMIESGQSVNVRLTAAAGTDQPAEAKLLIGGVEAIYSVTTFADSEAPTAEILFPPPVSMTEGTTLLVRGKAADDFNSVEAVQIRVNEGAAQDVVLTENDDGSTSWQVEVNLTAGENTIVVSTEDSKGISEMTAAQVSVLQDVNLGSFPDAKNPLEEPRALVIDRLNGRNRLLVAQGPGAGKYEIFSVDLNSGARSVFKSFNGLGFNTAQDLLLHESSGQLLARDTTQQIVTVGLDDPSQFSIYTVPGIGNGFVFTFDDSNEPLTLMAANQNNGNLVRVPLDFTAAEIFSDSSNTDQGPAMARTHGIVFDKANQRFLLTSPFNYTIYAVDSASGMRSIFSQTGDENGPDFGTDLDMYLFHLTIDNPRNRILVPEMTSGRIFAVDLTTGERSIFSSQTPTNSFNPMDWPRGLAIHNSDGYIFVSDWRDQSIFAVDIITGHRVYFSKN